MSIKDINSNKPFTVNQISNAKPNVKKSDDFLTGTIAGSMNGGHNRTIAFKKVMAGERHKEYRLKLNMQMLTPLSPAFQNLKCTIRAYFVPNSRVWENAEKYTAQKGGSTEIKIEEIPNLGGKETPWLMQDEQEGRYTKMENTTMWRDTYIGWYLPRQGIFEQLNLNEGESQPIFTILPKVSAIPLRGRKAIYNDFERNKQYDAEIKEFKSDTVSVEEWDSYLMPTTWQEYLDDPQNKYYNPDEFTMRAKRDNNYYTDYRTELQGFDLETPTNMDDNTALITWSAWESKIAETRSQAENAEMNDWDVIAKIRGSKKLSEGKVQLIGKTSFNLNYSAVAQTSYNNATNLENQYKVLGKQGAYSYTNVEVPVYAGMEFVEEGYVHIIATITADTVYEGAYDRNELNITPLSEYRPDLIGDKKDVLYRVELSTNDIYLETIEQTQEIVGFKRKYSEYFKLPNLINGDMTTNGYFETPILAMDMDTVFYEKTKIITQYSYQFFENSASKEIDGDFNIIIEKDIWKDYTDLQINKNQAIKNAIRPYYNERPDFYPEGGDEGYDYIYLKYPEIAGQNQIFYTGLAMLRAELPIDESIKENYTQWGEH